LSKKEHSSLRLLSARVEREDIQNFMTYLEQLTEQGDKENMDAVFQVSMAANTSVYDEIRKESRYMCEAFQELFKDEIDEKVKAGERRGRREGEQEGRIATLIGLAKDNLITISEAAKRAEMTEALFTEKMTNFEK
jgi:hypothetical protein